MHIHVYSLGNRLSVDFCCCGIKWMHQASAELCAVEWARGRALIPPLKRLHWEAEKVLRCSDCKPDKSILAFALLNSKKGRDDQKKVNTNVCGSDCALWCSSFYWYYYEQRFSLDAFRLLRERWCDVTFVSSVRLNVGERPPRLSG